MVNNTWPSPRGRRYSSSAYNSPEVGNEDFSAMWQNAHSHRFWSNFVIIMRTLDLIILFVYLIGTVLFGSWFSRRQRRGMNDYFVSGKSVPWWAIMASVVSTETSSLTFVSVPGLAFTGNFTFLQLVIG